MSHFDIAQANGNLVKVLIHTDVTKYLEFKAVDGSYVLNKGSVAKVGSLRAVGQSLRNQSVACTCWVRGPRLWWGYS